METGLGEIYRDALKNAIDGQVKIYDYANDFEIIWGKDGSGLPNLCCQSSDKPIVIVWDGPPKTDTKPGVSDAILEEHLTPLDWALAFSIKVLEAKPPQISIHIIDLTAHRYEEIWAIRMRHQLLADMPWVRLYTPIKPDVNMPFSTHESIMALDRDDATEAVLLINTDRIIWKINQNVCDRTIEISAKSGQGNRLKSLATQWAASLTQSNDHHDVNNVIGPDILAGAKNKRQGLPGAFLTKLAWSGNNLAELSNWEDWKALDAVKKNLFDRQLSVLVVDDQLQQGWGRFVCQLFENQPFDEQCTPVHNEFRSLNTFSGSSCVHIQGCLGSHPIIQFLDTVDFSCRNFSEQLQKNDVPQPELILLDLRLYADKGKAQECANELLEIIASKRLASVGSDLLAWPTFEKNELDDIRKWCDEDPDASLMASDNALMLLPRLLALALPLTPIILFSSTGKTKIRDGLKPYQNIFTGFEKPRVLSNPDSITASISALHDGLDKAVKMMRLRLQLAHAQQAIKVAISYRENFTQHLDTHHIELYVDETGILEEGITSGVAVCVYQDIALAELLQTQMLTEWERCGIVWAKNYRKLKSPPLLCKGYNNNQENKWKEQVDILKPFLITNALSGKNENLDLWSVVATRVEGIIPEKREVSLASFPDGPLDNALRFNIEFTLFVLIPFFVEESKQFNGSVNIFLATRTAYLMPADENQSKNLFNYAKKMFSDFSLGGLMAEKPDNVDLAPTKDQKYIDFYPNIKEGWHKVGLPTFSTDGGFVILRGWLHEWQQEPSKMSKKIIMVKTISLGMGETGLNPSTVQKRRLIHDIADWACSAAKKDYARIEMKRIFSQWLVSTDDLQFKEDTSNAFILMRALKVVLTNTSDNNPRTEALRILLHNTYITEINDRLLTNDNCAQQRLILWALKNELSSARGRDLYALLADDTGQPRTDASITEKPVSETKSSIGEL